MTGGTAKQSNTNKNGKLSVIPIGFEPMTYSIEIYSFLRQIIQKNSNSLLKYPKWATDKATFKLSCLNLQFTEESRQMPAFCIINQ
jgi:hypothetical protein